MRFFTGKGDDGTTDLLGERVEKDDPRVETLGDLDEATSSIGQARALASDPRLHDWMIEVQRDLYQIMAELAFTDDLRPDSLHLSPERTAHLGELTDVITAELELPRQFIIPGDSVAGAAFDVARSVVRRSERTCVSLDHAEALPNDEIVRYLNRLSSLLFACARLEDKSAGVETTRAKG